MIGAYTLRNVTYKPKTRNVLDLFVVEGEGGYSPSQFTFMYKSSCFFSTSIESTVRGIMKDDSKIKTLTISNTNYKYRDDILRIITGNKNSCILYRDGTADISNVSYSSWYTNLDTNVKENFATYIPKIRDNFCPSSYSSNGDQYQEMFLLENGDLILINPYKSTLKKLLSNVLKFVTKNQAHRSDAIVALKNGDMYHVWCGPTPRSADGNQTASGVYLINNLKYENVLFCAIGDPPACGVICLKAEPNKLYRFDKGYGTDFKIKGVLPTAIITLNTGEYFVDAMSNEFSTLLLTNKRLLFRSTAYSNGSYSYTASDWNSSVSWEKQLYPTNPTTNDPIIKAKKILTPTAYSMVLEDMDGKYWLCDRTASKVYTMNKPIPYTFFDTLKTYLEPIRLANL